MASAASPEWITLLTAFGLGSIATAMVQAWLAQRARMGDRSFQEKQAAYIGLLEAYHRAAVERTDEASKGFAYWQMRCDLVGSPDVREAVERVVFTNDDWVGRQKAHNDMKSAMRRDLGITR